MVRAVKSKSVRSLAKGQRAVLMPGPTEAEPWELWVFGGRNGGGADMVQVCQTPLDNRLRRTATLALPVARVYCLPLWLNETDSRQFAGMIPLQLELRGLQPRNDAAIFDWAIVAQEAARTLVLVGILPATLPPDLHAEAYHSFDLSARYLPFAPDALTLWREQGRLVMAITRGKNLAYYQSLAEGPISTRVVQDLGCTRATLEMQDVLPPLQKIVLWTTVNAEERAALDGAFGLPVVVEDAPSPVPAPTWKLTPAAIGQARRAHESQRWIRRGAVLLLVLYLGIVGWFVAQYVMLSLNVARLRSWQAANAPALDLVEQGRSTWKELAPVVDTKHYPFELLLHAKQAIPAEQLHLTLFESNAEGHLIIKGEAKNVAGAFTFLEKIKADPYFAGYHLDMGNPRPLPNDLAQFQIEGTRAPKNE